VWCVVEFETTGSAYAERNNHPYRFIVALKRAETVTGRPFQWQQAREVGSRMKAWHKSVEQDGDNLPPERPDREGDPDIYARRTLGREKRTNKSHSDSCSPATTLAFHERKISSAAASAPGVTVLWR